MQKEKLVILDFGGKYRDLLARRVRELEVYCEVKPGNIDLAKIKEAGYQAIIISAAAPSEEQYNPDLKIPFDEIRALGLPVLAVNLSEDLLDKYDVVYLDDEDPSFSSSMQLFHISLAAKTDSKRLFQTKLEAFLKGRCRFEGNWRMDRYVEEQIAKIREEVGDSKVLCALSGGVDSSVAALMVHKAVGKQLTCIFVDHGLMRKNEGDQVEKVFSEQFDVNFIRVNAEDRFLSKLAGVSDPEKKRKIIGEEFIRVFEEEALKFKDCDYLVQGTIYPDVIESGIGGAVIKSHHNVGGLPEDIQFKGLVEPLRLLFKDEVRKAGLVLGLPEELVWRQPFPGPGLAIRCLGEITKERLDILRDADAIFREEIINAGLHKAVGQYFAVLTNLRSVGVSTRGGQGDQRSYDYTLALRAVDTSDFMSAEWTKLPYGLLETCSSRIIREVAGINRVVYDITSKPPATIEWE